MGFNVVGSCRFLWTPREDIPPARACTAGSKLQDLPPAPHAQTAQGTVVSSAIFLPPHAAKPQGFYGLAALPELWTAPEDAAQLLLPQTNPITRVSFQPHEHLRCHSHPAPSRDPAITCTLGFSAVLSSREAPRWGPTSCWLLLK